MMDAAIDASDDASVDITGCTFSEPTTLVTLPADTDLTASLASGASSWIAVWAPLDGTGERGYARVVDSSGSAGSTMPLANTDAVLVRDPQAVASDDGFIAVYSQADSNALNAFEIWMHALNPDGSSKAAPVPLTNDAIAQHQPRIARWGDNYVIGWVAIDDMGASTVEVGLFDSAGAVVRAAAPVTSDSATPLDFSLNPMETAVALTILDGTGIAQTLGVAGLAPDTGSLGGQSTLANTEPRGPFAVATSSAGGAAVYDVGADRRDVFFRPFNTSFDAFGAEKRVGASDLASRDAAITTYRGGYIVLYRGYDTGARRHVRFTARDNDGVELLDTLVRTTTDTSGSTGIAVTGEGMIYGLWSDTKVAGTTLKGSVITCTP